MNAATESLIVSVQGVVELVSDYVVCREGDRLTSNQAALLRVFDVKMAAFKMFPMGYWLAEGMASLHNICHILNAQSEMS